MLGLYISLALLGLSAIDPVGIAAMPILLVQKRPYRRSLVFLSGSFVALVAMGLVFAHGFGAIFLRFENANKWFVPLVEMLAGLTLLVTALFVYQKSRSGKSVASTPKSMTKRLSLGDGKLFVVGALLVTFQSIVDVVFVIAMVKVGQMHLSGIELIAAVITYAGAALVIQLAVIVAYRLTPPGHRDRTLHHVQRMIDKYSNRLLIAVSLVLGLLLLGLGLLAIV